ncbi:helix-turn-helix transcriptional regulator [Pseudonocardia terrae]|uniref:helix-turn-helix transcriptional regulator n=1 Tax=Pseudonocardia terrae TaxID=2905831 RepID=UPI0035589F1F
MGGRILSISEAAARLGRSPDTLRYWRRRREGPPSFKIGRRVVFYEHELDAWVEAQRLASLPEGAA